MKYMLYAIALVAMLFSPAKAWETADMNNTVNQTNFIIGDNNCSGTLISLRYRLVLTNHHCVGGFYKSVEHDVVVGDVVMKEQVVEYTDVPLSQKFYGGFDEVGTIQLLGKIVAAWEEGDLALVQIRAENLPYTIESSVYTGDTIVRGEEVWIVGNPNGYDASVMRGIVSSTTRMLPWGGDGDTPFFQTDAGITFGNSGGAMYNADGELIGVPATTIAGTVLGMAIPYTTIREFLDNECYTDVWNHSEGVETHDACVKRKAAEIVATKIVATK